MKIRIVILIVYMERKICKLRELINNQDELIKLMSIHYKILEYWLTNRKCQIDWQLRWVDWIDDGYFVKDFQMAMPDWLTIEMSWPNWLVFIKEYYNIGFWIGMPDWLATKTVDRVNWYSWRNTRLLVFQMWMLNWLVNKMSMLR